MTTWRRQKKHGVEIDAIEKRSMRNICIKTHKIGMRLQRGQVDLLLHA